VKASKPAAKRAPAKKATPGGVTATRQWGAVTLADLRRMGAFVQRTGQPGRPRKGLGNSNLLHHTIAFEVESQRLRTGCKIAEAVRDVALRHGMLHCQCNVRKIWQRNGVGRAMAHFLSQEQGR
jgi:hypothetical protein